MLVRISEAINDEANQLLENFVLKCAPFISLISSISIEENGEIIAKMDITEAV